ncbi:M23 family metallopeptidase [Microbacterium sp. zg.Y1090]|uniref:M23 family metallopeptidase n=1 Tax=Microbacterium TaxID=33882 RepID=UPI00214A8F14|nr:MULTISPECIES: M23 family metallopeptidase [unclassified Microbacterium]MCR2812578.1 M23 family metallopeptidase [Microbacterium sp. zg.Y1084]MCR2817621.1 M23 family metallopeptidase [Microbacterium sp. zg.Y1090]WIM28903.1 M23 family metallopeptidase [Microbacterium sp. zg-Y1090]
MTLDAPSAVPAPARRSDRIAAANARDAVASDAPRVLTRAELRQRAAVAPVEPSRSSLRRRASGIPGESWRVEQPTEVAPEPQADAAQATAPQADAPQADAAHSDASQVDGAQVAGLAAFVVAAAAVELPAALTRRSPEPASVLQPSAAPMTRAARAAAARAARAPEPLAIVAPDAQVPAVEAPAAEAPAVEAPAVEAPAAEAPAVEVPAVEVPAVEAPAVEVAVADVAVTLVPVDDASLTAAPQAQPPLRRRARRAEAATPPASAAADIDATAEADCPLPDAVTSAPAAPQLDDFERAAKIFAFAGSARQQAAGARAGERAAPRAQVAPCAEGTPPRGWAQARKRLAAASASIGAMGVVGLLAISMTTPAGAVAAGEAQTVPGAAATSASAEDALTETDEIQAFVASAATTDISLGRDANYTTATRSDLAAESGVRNFDNSFISDPNSPVQWPFPVGVPYTWGFQMRDGSMHHGIDFVPGQGAEIHAIADGTVRVATEAGGLYGVHVIIDHVIDGELVSSHYAHMEYGSLNVAVGDTITVGEVLGTVGDTGYSFGAHLHFEILQNGSTRIDPLPWMREHTGG